MEKISLKLLQLAQRRGREIQKNPLQNVKVNKRFSQIHTNTNTHTHSGSSGVTGLSDSALDTRAWQHIWTCQHYLSAPINAFAHTGIHKLTHEQTTTHTHTLIQEQTYKTRERQSAKGSTNDGFKYRCDERTRLHGYEEKKWRETESNGGMEGSKGGSESIPCWSVWKRVAVSRHEKEQNKCDAVRILLSVNTERAGAQTHHYHRWRYKNKCNQHAADKRISPFSF